MFYEEGNGCFCEKHKMTKCKHNFCLLVIMLTMLLAPPDNQIYCTSYQAVDRDPTRGLKGDKKE